MAAPTPKPPPTEPSQIFSTEPSPQFTSGPAVEAATVASLQSDLERARGEYDLGRDESAFRIVTDLVAKLKGTPASEVIPERVFLLASALCLLGRLCSVQGDENQAQEAFTESVSLFESHKTEIEREKTATRTWIDYGIALFRIGRASEAVDVLNLVDKSGPMPVEAFHYLGLAYQKSDRIEEAESVFRKGLQLAPTDPHLLAYLAHTLDRPGKQAEAVPAYRDAALAEERLKHFEKAAQLANRALEITPTDVPALTTAVGIERARQNLPRALELVNAVLQHNPRHASALGIKGMLLRESGDLNEAIKTLCAIDVETPELAWILVELADTLNQLNSDHGMEALALLDRALALNPRHAGANYIRAQILLGRHEFTKAIQALGRAIEIDPQSVLLHSQLGRALFLSGDFTRAQEAFTQALSLDPKSAMALSGKAHISRAEGRLEEALDLLRRASHLAPDNSTIFESIIDLLLEQGLTEKALVELENEIRRNPQTVSAYSRKGQILLDRKELNGAVEAFKAAIALNPDDPGVVVNLAETLRGLDKFDEAGEAYNRALELQPDSSYIIGLKAFYLSEIASFREASDLIERAIKKARDEQLLSWLWYILAWCLQQLGKSSADRARQAFDRALETDKDNVWYRKGLADTLCQLGSEEQKEATKYFEAIIEHQKYEKGDDANTLALLGWCHYRLRRYDEAVRLLHAAFAIDQDPVAQFDLGLVLLVSSRFTVASAAYELAVQLASKKHVLRQRGLYYVALFDLVEAATDDNIGNPDWDAIFTLLRERLATTGVNLTELPWLGDRLFEPGR